MLLTFARSSTELSAPESSQLCDLLIQYGDVFSNGQEDLGKNNVVAHKINTETAIPMKQPPRRLPLALRGEAKKIEEIMLQQGTIEPSTSPWTSPVVLVKKKDGTWRFCVDYRKLNEVTKKDSYPVPRIDETVERLARCKWFSSLDLRSGYWQVQMDPSDKEKTAFTTGSVAYGNSQ